MVFFIYVCFFTATGLKRVAWPPPPQDGDIRPRKQTPQYHPPTNVQQVSECMHASIRYCQEIGILPFVCALLTTWLSILDYVPFTLTSALFCC